jgi:NADH:ubiquinone oxidoreductase subunit 6 (subunit J)
MTSLALILTYLGCLSSRAMLSMLILLVGAYISAAIWLILHGVIYTGLLYVLVYVGAIVVLIMFVVQLTNTNLISRDGSKRSSSLILIQNTVLVVCLFLLLTSAYSILDSNLLLSVSSLNLTDVMVSPNQTTTSQLNASIHGNNLSILASSIFNEYGYVLVISVHAIILAVIGPIKLALADLNNLNNKNDCY